MRNSLTVHNPVYLRKDASSVSMRGAKDGKSIFAAVSWAFQVRS